MVGTNHSRAGKLSKSKYQDNEVGIIMIIKLLIVSQNRHTGILKFSTIVLYQEGLPEPRRENVT